MLKTVHSILFALALVGVVAVARAEPVPGSMDVSWIGGAADCAAEEPPPLQVHAYEPQTFILRQNPCVHFEAPFLYLLVGSEKALLIDTGAVADAEQMPLARTVMGLLSGGEAAGVPLLVLHSHGHGDHRAGDEQFTALPSVQVVSSDLDEVRAFFGFEAWPNGVAHLDLGGRTVDVVPAPGHHPAHLVFYDHRTALLLTGDFLLPGRLLVDDIAAYRASAQRVVEALNGRPIAHVLGGHVELDRSGRQYAWGSQHHADERPLELTRADLLRLPAALHSFNGFYARHQSFVITNPTNILRTLVVGAVAGLILFVWGVRAFVRGRRRRAAAG